MQRPNLVKSWPGPLQYAPCPAGSAFASPPQHVGEDLPPASADVPAAAHAAAPGVSPVAFAGAVERATYRLVRLTGQAPVTPP